MIVTSEDVYCDVAAIQCAIRGLRYGNRKAVSAFADDLAAAADELSEIAIEAQEIRERNKS